MSNYPESEMAGACRKLDVWVGAMELAECVYTETRAMPSEERYGLTLQIRRSATSIAANISEGSGRRTKKDFAHFLSIARGSLRETETLWLLARRMEFVQESKRLNSLCGDVGRMLTQFVKKLNG